MAAPTNSFKNTLIGYMTYRGKEGHYAYLLHRLTGLGTLLFLIIHIVDTATVYFIPHLYEEAIGLYQSTPFMIGEIGLVFAVIYHGVNGLRIAYVDLKKPEGWNINSQEKGVRFTLILSTIFWLPAALIMLRALLMYNFGLFGG